MTIFDILGPIMVGPSSSHTAGAVRIGFVSRQLLAEPVKDAAIYLHGSFLKTAQGHGTDRAIVAGLLGMDPDDIRIPDSFLYAEKVGMHFAFHPIILKEVHPNTCQLVLTGRSGQKLTIIASSLGGGIIKICKIDGLDANFGGDYPTLVIHNDDKPGHVTEVSMMLAKNEINIATMQLYRDIRGGRAVMIIECDQEVPSAGIKWLNSRPGIHKVTYLSQEHGKEMQEV